MQKFQYNGAATISHISVRKEGNEETGAVTAVDLKLTIELDPYAAGQFFDADLPHFLFTASGKQRNAWLGQIPYLFELENYILALPSTTVKILCRLKKFLLAASPEGAVIVTFSLSCKPEGNQLSLFAEMLSQAVMVDIRPGNGELI